MRRPSRARSARCSGARACTALVEWRRLHRAGALQALARPRGRPRAHPLAKENERLRREVGRFSTRLTWAERIILIQGKVSELLGIPLAQSSDDESES